MLNVCRVPTTCIAQGACSPVAQICRFDLTFLRDILFLSININLCPSHYLYFSCINNVRLNKFIFLQLSLCLLFINNPFDFLVWYFTTFTHFMMHPAHRQQVIVIQPLIVIRLYRYGVMDGQVLVVVLPV
jgi:hypothetical protein